MYRSWVVYVLEVLAGFYLNVFVLFTANHFQVTALLAFGKYLYASTTWGCVIVADAYTMSTYSVFRCHGNEEFYCKAILPIGPAIQFNTASRDSSELLYDRLGCNGASSYRQKSKPGAGVVTVGRGYVDVIKRVTDLDSQVLVQHSADGLPLVNASSASNEEHASERSDKCNTFVLSWDPQHWNYY